MTVSANIAIFRLNFILNSSCMVFALPHDIHIQLWLIHLMFRAHLFYMFVLVSKLSEWNYMFIILSTVPIEMGWLMKTWKRGKLNESAKHDCGFYYGHRDITMEPNLIK